jgi:hypothetical protein
MSLGCNKWQPSQRTSASARFRATFNHHRDGDHPLGAARAQSMLRAKKMLRARQNDIFCGVCSFEFRPRICMGDLRRTRTVVVVVVRLRHAGARPAKVVTPSR